MISAAHRVLARVVLVVLVVGTAVVGGTCPSGAATSLWVANSGNNSASGTEAAPLRTIAAAVAKAAPGTTINVSAGQYPESLKVKKSGAPDAPITLRARGEASITGAPKSDTGRILQIFASHWVVEGFSITGQDNPVWLQQARNVVMRDNEISHADGECVRIKYKSSGNVIERNFIHDCGRGDFVKNPGDGKNGEGVYIGTAPEQLDRNPTHGRDHSDGNIVRDNVITTNGNECVDIKEGARANVVEFNNCTGQRDPESAGFDSRGNGNVFRYNRSSGNAGGGIRLGGDTEADGLDNSVIGNVLVDNEGYGIKVLRVPQGVVCGNTIERNGSGAIRDKSITNEPCSGPIPTPGPRQ